MTWTFRTGAAFAALSVLALAGCGGDDHSPVERQTVFGTVVGTDNSATSGTYAWKGVPFATAPVGDLRWKPPVDPTAGRRPSTRSSSATPACSRAGCTARASNNKYDATIGTSLGQTVGSEDCLYLNIWRPAGAATQLPVIVWVHGGSNISGYTADPMYDGAHLARTANAIVVSVNYRLGVFGFLNMAQLKTGDHAERLGRLRDPRHRQGAEVRQRNIAAFGGDPATVTLMGQSAGAVERLRGDDLAAGRQRQPVAGPSPAADQRRPLARRRAARRQHRDAGAGVGVRRAGRLLCSATGDR